MNTVIHKLANRVPATWSASARYFSGVNSAKCTRIVWTASSTWKGVTCKQCLRHRP